MGIDFHDDWKWIVSGFKGHKIVVPAAEEWLQKHISDGWNDFEIAHVAKLIRSEKCKQLLIVRLKEGKSTPQWIISTLVEIWGSNDPEIRGSVMPLLVDENRVGAFADFLPDFFEKNDCLERLISLLEKVKGFEVHHVLEGIEKLGGATDGKLLAVIEKRMSNDWDGLFWYGAKSYLLKYCSENTLVRNRALKELTEPEPSIGAIVKAYSRDSEFQQLFNALIQTLDDDLRLTLVQSVRKFMLRDDSFARRILNNYSREYDGETRTAAAIGYYTSVQKLSDSRDADVARLLSELHETGPGYQEKSQAAIAGLLVLGEIQKLVEALTKDGKKGLTISVNVREGNNWELIQLIIDKWDLLVSFSGGAIWSVFRNWDVLIWRLAQARKRRLALTIPDSIISEYEHQASFDVDVFKALSVLRDNQQSFKDYCITLISKLRRNPNQTSVNWGHNEVPVWFEAARYLAVHYGGEKALGLLLEEIATNSHEPSPAIIALCIGWPNSSFLETIWISRTSEKLNDDPGTAWIVSIKSSPTQFADYVLALPETLFSSSGGSFWKFPTETVRAVRHRLTTDIEAQQIIIKKSQESFDNNVIALACRLFEMIAADKRTLHGWASNRVEAFNKQGKFQPLGFDIMYGRVRPIEFCLLEACLTS
jgi:hypothetical protein